MARWTLSFAIGSLYAVALASGPTQALAGALPSTLSLRWGFDQAASTRQPDYSDIPTVSTTWPLGGHASLWSSVSYFRESTRLYATYPEFQVGNPYSRYLPASLGLRVHGCDAQGHQRGLFLEFGPSITPAWYRDRSGDSGFALMGGLQAGSGFRIATIEGARTEIGASYYLAEAFGEHANAFGRIGTPKEVDVSVFAVYVSLGLGD